MSAGPSARTCTLETGRASPAEGEQQVQLRPVRRVDEFALNGEEAAVMAALRRRRGAGVEETPLPRLTAARTWRSEVNTQSVAQRKTCEGVGFCRCKGGGVCGGDVIDH